MKGQMLKSGEQEKKFVYADLLTDNAPKISDEYTEEAAILHKEIEKPNVFNIAVVAKYGAGKSSAINTYLSYYRNKRVYKEKKKNIPLGDPERNKYARISLASFNETKKNESSEVYDETAIERSVLQQLLYSTKREKLPNSRIERTNKSSWIKSIIFAMVCVICVIAIALMGTEFIQFSKHINSNKAESLFGIWWLRYLFLGISAICLTLILFIVFHYHKLRKIKYKDFEADFNDKKECGRGDTAHLINKFVNEVLYFFECLDINLVIFEDLDRLPTVKIFTKLRELNTIINESKKKASKVTFLYAVKDELFKTEEERAKFFEFILPIVPVINPMTIQSELGKRVNQLKNINPKMEVDGKLIKGISVFIPDMRILKNTFNDYIIMFHKIFEDKNAKAELDVNKLFALCLYKNLFPYDYALLEHDQGLVPQIVDMAELRHKCVQNIEIELKKAEARLEEIKSERINSFKELRSIFIGQLSEYNTTSSRIGRIDPWKLTTFENLDFSSVMHPKNVNHYTVNIPIGAEIFAYDGRRYIDIEKNIIERENNGIELLKNKIADLKNQVQIQATWALDTIIEHYGVEFCFADDNEAQYIRKYSIENLQKEQIELQITYLRFLVAQNYIDEHYIEYTSKYRAEILSPNDVKIVQAIQGYKKNFNYNIENIISVIRWLNEEDFKNPTILIKQLLDNIDKLKNCSLKEHDKKFDNFFELLSNTKNTEIFNAIHEYLSIADLEKCEILLRNLVPLRQGLFAEMIDNSLCRSIVNLMI